MLQPYVSESYSDFSDKGTAAAYRNAQSVVEGQLGVYCPVVIGGRSINTAATTTSVNPARPEQVVGTAAVATSALADDALVSAWAAFPAWSATPANERAQIVHRIGDLMNDRKFEFAAWMTYEAGKNWSEAEADTAEAIDFCRYYAHSSIAMAEPVETADFAGESNISWYQPLGAGVAIPPWNFPLAILVGMSIGPIAAGNTIVLKPASATPVIGYMFSEVAVEAGLPPGVLNYLPGPGSVIGDALVDNPRTRFINFTGSKEIGLRIAERAAVVGASQKWLKRVYVEMGGKDALIVDETADLETAADDAVRSAFGFQGQKCSACSRLIVVDEVYDDVLGRVTRIAGELSVGDPTENRAVGPLISAAQLRSVRSEIDLGRSEAQLVLGGEAVTDSGGYYLAPTVFADVEPNSRLAQHEIFGPVLSVIRARNFDHALDIANGTEFGLTGGLHTSDRDRIERVKREFHVGNLYINRKITGALVGIQPFGGFNMSGSNAKAGGPDYLRLFMEMKTVAERL